MFLLRKFTINLFLFFFPSFLFSYGSPFEFENLFESPFALKKETFFSFVVDPFRFSNNKPFAQCSRALLSNTLDLETENCIFVRGKNAVFFLLQMYRLCGKPYVVRHHTPNLALILISLYIYSDSSLSDEKLMATK